ncbi:uncharacterized protein LOC135389090 [Ornithodoros turicata]|uniref:uncharacterized protein LOC135389090 n=1 Tax=Ornithodoros turicata TaxID=34597 RepID=UPI00313A3EE0
MRGSNAEYDSMPSPLPGYSNDEVMESSNAVPCYDSLFDEHSIGSSSADESQEEITMEAFILEAKKSVCHLFFQVSDVHKVPRSTSEKIFDGFQSLFDLILKNFCKLIRRQLESEDVTENETLNALLGHDFVDDIFAEARTSYQREFFAKRHFPFVEPDTYQIGHDSSFQYVRIGRVLTCLLQKPEMSQYVCYDRTSASPAVTTLKDFRDGSVYKQQQSSVLHTSSVRTLFVLLYTDELEVLNPIGPRRGVHKLFVVYFSLLNLHPRFRSQTQHMHLVVLAKYKDVQRHGLHQVLRPMLDDLKMLCRDGIQYCKESELCTARVLVQAFCGDNLSLNKLGGFSASFVTGRVCRFCIAQAKDLHSLTREELCVLRTNSVHKQHILAITVNPDNKKLYGVNEKSPLMDLEYFDVTLQLPPDLMHDLFEGCFAFVMHQVLKGLVHDGVLVAGDLSKVASFPYGFHDGHNKPDGLSSAFLSDYHSLRGTASQKWCLFRLLPLIFGSSIPEDNEHWKVYLSFRGIVDILLAEEMPTESIAYLQVEIQDFLKSFTDLYPSARILPKMHHLIHYPRIMAALGPLKMYWCMRFEGKHQYFKNVATKLKNFKNICKSLATRHQLMQCYYLYGPFQGSRLETSKAKVVTTSSVRSCIQEVSGEDNILEVTRATIGGTTYRTSDVLVAKKGDMPEFSLICGLYVIAGKLHILLNDLNVEEFCRHRCAYKVSPSGVFRVSFPGQEASYHMLDLYFGSEVTPMWDLAGEQ